MAARKITRREFVKKGALGLAAAGFSASSYSRILGANDRLSLGLIGCSGFARGAHLGWVFSLSKELNVELTAACDIWSVNRERAGKKCDDFYKTKVRRFKHADDMLSKKDIDAVLLATGEFQHWHLLKQVVESGRDCYCEKPLGVWEKDVTEAYRAVRKSGRIVQIGTQGRSSPKIHGVAKVIRSGILGKISRVEVSDSYWGPRWRNHPDGKLVREKDTDWKAWLVDRPYRPFDPRLYFDYRLYTEFSTGILGQLMVHQVAALQLMMGVTFPKSAMCMGENLVWKDGRENPDTVIALVEYPEGFIYSYSNQFGNKYPGRTMIYGLNGTIVSEKGGFKITGEGGGEPPTPENLAAEKKYGSDPTYTKRVNPKRVKEERIIEPSGGTPGSNGHMRNWLECVRSRRHQDLNADILSGYAATMVCIMCQRSRLTGKRVYWDQKNEKIVDTPPEA